MEIREDMMEEEERRKGEGGERCGNENNEFERREFLLERKGDRTKS
jgi:hypothetical protein